MTLRVLAFAVAMALPTVSVAQRPQTPNEHASGQAQAMVALHRATHRRGTVVRVDVDRNPNSAMSVTRAGRASPFGGGPDGPGQPGATGEPASPGQPLIPALPATPAHKSGQSTNHRP